MERNNSNNLYYVQQATILEQKSSNSPVQEACMRELRQLISVTLESNKLNLRKLQQAANDFRLCAKTFKICDVELQQSFLIQADNNRTP
ncbi:hypothetical protein Gasu2_22220 [Galdieria sulphuraria]|uniref:Uncharacterized protein n=1 Tax=Galdieria sulphuraria TaxID=130081 RepID=M2X813_GALSU|nr:uncharacterized protein Gasu_00630 [Galdieria sulphuraria]EME32695.1 hypothetical protein Gasu_00630 [Galdieria sulphuraria]GJD07897.1 hypothetical protein Gasu2_22220 [Galdieria sulphuraria]|eukprot:XP_005709215.1 hypothetical protein Gasu_00630 [Galdieria sulphuraria]